MKLQVLLNVGVLFLIITWSHYVEKLQIFEIHCEWFDKPCLKPSTPGINTLTIALRVSAIYLTVEPLIID